MKWIKKGLIYQPSNEGGWRHQFSICPTPYLINDRKLRIFVGFCDENNVGRTGYIDVNPDNLSEVLYVSEKPILDIGEAGCFDDNGAVSISLVEDNNLLYLYYIGFQLGVKVPYYMFCGVAISYDNGENFQKYSKSPVLDRVDDEVYARCGVNVIKDENKFKMWYIGSYKEGWTESNGKLKPLYMMKYTESDDGIHWNNPSVQCMNYMNDDEHGFGRPHVWKENAIYKMLYSIRTYSRGYYLGYAESADGIKWDRKDKQVGIDLSSDGWDSENLSYSHLWRYKGKTYMFYNGNGCGKTGFGYAELVE